MNDYSSAQLPAKEKDRLSQIRLRLLQGAWILASVTTLALFVILIPVNYNATQFSWEIRSSSQILLGWISRYELVVYIIALRYLAASIFLAVAGIIFWRRRDDWVAVLTSITLILSPLAFNLTGNIGAMSPLIHWKPLLESAREIFSILPLWCVLLILLVFPDGRFVPGWTRWLAWTSIPVILGLSLVPFEETIPFSAIAWSIFLLGTLVAAVTALGSQIYRYRWVSTPLERQQTKWAFIGLIVYIQWALGPWWWLASDGDTPLANLLTLHLEVLFPIFIPLTLGFSFLRYRLWDIDVLIRRTMIYGALTGTLAVVFFTVVLVLQSLLPSQTNLTTVLSTLAIAALFSPLRHRIQSDIDRRFYRKKYKADQILNSFSATVRDEVDLDQLSDALLRALTEAVQPTQASLWLKPSVGAERSQQAHLHETEA